MFGDIEVFVEKELTELHYLVHIKLGRGHLLQPVYFEVAFHPVVQAVEVFISANAEEAVTITILYIFMEDQDLARHT